MPRVEGLKLCGRKLFSGDLFQYIEEYRRVGSDYLAEEVASHTGDDKNAKIMDIACGTGIMGKKVSPLMSSASFPKPNAKIDLCYDSNIWISEGTNVPHILVTFAADQCTRKLHWGSLKLIC
jgi:hypothetical protein